MTAVQEIWIKLYLHRNDTDPSELKIKNFEGDIYDLKEKIKEKEELQFPASRLDVYPPGTLLANIETTDPLPLSSVPPENTNVFNPLIVIPRERSPRQTEHTLGPRREEPQHLWFPVLFSHNKQYWGLLEEFGKRTADTALTLYDLKRRRIEGKRPQRSLSYISKSAAFQQLDKDGRLERGVNFFFPLKNAEFKTEAFGEEAPPSNADENSIHHTYFLLQMKTLIADAVKAGLTIRQQLYWSKSGKWMTLDDHINPGVEPDFCMTEVSDKNRLVPDSSLGARPPQSKYDVSVALEMKKGFADTDQIEAIDYAERLLCFQRGRSRAYCALFHCCEKEKMIRWLEIREEDGRFKTRISQPQSLAPGGAGQKELLTVMMTPSAGLGLDFPKIRATETDETVAITSILGEGATSVVYAALFRGQHGVLKLLKQGFHDLADREAEILGHLHEKGVPGIPSCETVCDGALFFTEEYTHVEALSPAHLKDLLICLEETHKASVVHRDVRPSNIMQDMSGNVRLIDWGLAHHNSPGTECPTFAGTFRFASDEVLASALKNELRQPLPQDDLHSLVRVILAENAAIREGVEDIANGDLQKARSYWLEKRQKNENYEWLFNLAEEMSYDGLKQAKFS